jgi:hypothetical protein
MEKGKSREVECPFLRRGEGGMSKKILSKKYLMKEKKSFPGVKSYGKGLQRRR